MDEFDQILAKSAKKHMVSFNLIQFKIDFPSLYATIRESLKYAATQFDQPREVSRKDLQIS